MKESPDIFDFKDVRGSNPKVVSTGRYILGLIDNLGARGLCAFYNGGAIQVKKTNNFDDSFVVLASTGYVRRGSNAYSVTCVPASFPVGESTTPPPDAPGCALGGSRSIACGNDTPKYLNQLSVAIAQVIKDHPELFDFGDVQAGTSDGYKVLNPSGFTKAVSDTLTTQGFCSIFTGDMQVKLDNVFSENYHILTGSIHIRHDQGSFDGSCYPAAF